MSDDRYTPRPSGREGEWRLPNGEEGPLPEDFHLGPAERWARKAPAPPLACLGCGLDLQRASHPAESTCTRSAPEGEPISRDEGNVVRMKLNGYQWPRELVFPKANGST